MLINIAAPKNVASTDKRDPWNALFTKAKTSRKNNLKKFTEKATGYLLNKSRAFN
jgi:hypothetical protein